MAKQELQNEPLSSQENRRIREAVRRMEITYHELADMVGVNRSAVSRWRSGESAPCADNRERLAKAIGHEFVPAKVRSARIGVKVKS